MRSDGPRLWPIILHWLGSLSHRFGLYVCLVGWEGGGGGGWFLGGGCRGGIGCGSSSSYSSSLSEVSDSSSWVGLACLACHGGSGPHSSGRSGSGV